MPIRYVLSAEQPKLVYVLIAVLSLFVCDAIASDPTGEITNRFHVKASGDVVYEETYDIPERTFTQEVFWKCSGQGLNVGFGWGGIGRPEWETLAIAVDQPIAPGQTGVFKLRGMFWANGREPLPGQPADSKFLGPRNFEGEDGELRITRHIATSMSERRIQGIATGQVKSVNGNLSVQIHAEFDLKESCGILP